MSACISNLSAVFVGFVKLALFSILQLSFEGWTQQARDVLGARKRGDSAFECKRFRIAINGYSEVYHSNVAVAVETQII
jgi:hypothetical protein